MIRPTLTHSSTGRARGLLRRRIKNAGAGEDLKGAETPAVMEVEGKGRVIVFSFGSVTSGIPSSWAASKEKPGVNLLEDLSDKAAQYVKEKVEEVKQKGDILIASIHWGGNWGYQIPHEQRESAHKLIDTAGVDLIHGHSSHHVKGIEVYQGKLILYGCGDFLNDYEGIGGYEHYRGDLALMYLVSVDPPTGKLVHLQMTPTQTRRFRVNRAPSADVEWLKDLLNREGEKFGNRVVRNEDNILTLIWD
jgi:poly-gamma-glutamate capsule biosynthesis protein CapA/YwtB (metallophosphatase superfamily)